MACERCRSRPEYHSGELYGNERPYWDYRLVGESVKGVERKGDREYVFER
jgi:hypothetical protein